MKPLIVSLVLAAASAFGQIASAAAAPSTVQSATDGASMAIAVSGRTVDEWHILTCGSPRPSGHASCQLLTADGDRVARLRVTARSASGRILRGSRARKLFEKLFSDPLSEVRLQAPNRRWQVAVVSPSTAGKLVLGPPSDPVPSGGPHVLIIPLDRPPPEPPPPPPPPPGAG